MRRVLVAIAAGFAVLVAGLSAAAADDGEADAALHRASSGVGLDLGIGALAATRRMHVVGESGDLAHRPGIYLGGTLHLTLTVLELESSAADVVVDARGGYARGKGTEVDPNRGRQLVTDYSFGRVQAIVERSVKPNLELRAGLGFGATSVTVEPNARYTGHRYATLIGSLRAMYWFPGTTFRAGGGVELLPSLWTNESGASDGPARAFGISIGGEGVWRIYAPNEGDRAGVAEAGLRYDFSHFRTTLPGAARFGERAHSNDDQHVLSLVLRYGL